MRRFRFLKLSPSYRLISMLFNGISRPKSQNLKQSCGRKFWAKLFKKPTKCTNSALNQSGASKFCRSANQDQVILPSIEGKLRKNALCLNQSAFSNLALYVIITEIPTRLIWSGVFKFWCPTSLSLNFYQIPPTLFWNSGKWEQSCLFLEFLWFGLLATPSLNAK